MTEQSRPYIRCGHWVCGVCASKITEYDLHGSPVEKKDVCPFCKRHITWEKVLTQEGR